MLATWAGLRPSGNQAAAVPPAQPCLGLQELVVGAGIHHVTFRGRADGHGPVGMGDDMQPEIGRAHV